jgi:hypothetical protein
MQCCQSERKSVAMVFHSFLFILSYWKMRVLFSFYIPFSCCVGTPETVLSYLQYRCRIGSFADWECCDFRMLKLFLCLSRARAVRCIAVLRVFLLCRCLGRILTGISTGFGFLWTVLGTVQVQRLFCLRDCYSWCACCPCVWLFIPWLH